MREGANSSIHELMNKTSSTTRNEITQARTAQAVQQITNDSTVEISRQLRDSFMIQSAETTAIVDELFKKHGLELYHCPTETPLPLEVLKNEAFTQSFSRLRGMADYIGLIAQYGYQYCLTSKQCTDLANIIGMHSHRRRLVVKVAKDLEQSLEELLSRAGEPPMKNLKLG